MLAGELAFPKNCPMSSPSNNLSAYLDASPPARPGWDPQWLAANEHCVPEKLDSCRLRIDEELTGLVWRLSGRHCGRCIVPSDPHFPEYLQRLKLCIDFHWRRWGETARLTFAEVVRRLDQERADAKPPKDNILAEVVLAQGLQLGEDQCARTFESIYMPVVRAVGRHLGGERAADVVENFAAELVLPRQGRPPRIATRWKTTPIQGCSARCVPWATTPRALTGRFRSGGVNSSVTRLPTGTSAPRTRAPPVVRSTISTVSG